LTGGILVLTFALVFPLALMPGAVVADPPGEGGAIILSGLDSEYHSAPGTGSGNAASEDGYRTQVEVLMANRNTAATGVLVFASATSTQVLGFYDSPEGVIYNGDQSTPGGTVQGLDPAVHTTTFLTDPEAIRALTYEDDLKDYAMLVTVGDERWLQGGMTEGVLDALYDIREEIAKFITEGGAFWGHEQSTLDNRWQFLSVVGEFQTLNIGSRTSLSPGPAADDFGLTPEDIAEVYHEAFLAWPGFMDVIMWYGGFEGSEAAMIGGTGITMRIPDAVHMAQEPADADVEEALVSSVKVVDDQGDPVVGAVVHVSEEGGYAIPTGTTTRSTNSTGIALFDDLEIHTAGTYILKFEADGVDDPVLSREFYVGPVFPDPPSADWEEAYSAPVVKGMTSPLVFNVTEGELPPGLELNATTGQLAGTPTQNGVFNYTIQITDANGLSYNASYSQKVVMVIPPDEEFTVHEDHEARVNVTGGPGGGTANLRVSITEDPPQDKSVPAISGQRAHRYLDITTLDGTQWDDITPINITMHYNATQMLQDRIDPEGLTIHYFNGTHWVDTQPARTIEGTPGSYDRVVTTSGNSVDEGFAWAVLDRASSFVLAGPAIPGGGGGGGGASHQHAEVSARAVATIDGADASYASWARSLADGGTLTAGFPEPSIIEQLGLSLEKGHTQVVLYGHELSSPVHPEAPGQAGLEPHAHLRLDIEATGGAIPEADVEGSNMTLRFHPERVGHAEARSLVVLAYDDEAGTWDILHTDLLTHEPDQIRLRVVTTPGVGYFMLAQDVAPPLIELPASSEAGPAGPLDEIVVNVTDNRGVADAVLLIDGETRDAVFDGEQLRYTPQAPLESGERTLSVTATDTSGLSSSESTPYHVQEAEAEGAPDEAAVALPSGPPVLLWVLLAALALVGAGGFLLREPIAQKIATYRLRAKIKAKRTKWQMTDQQETKRPERKGP
jgi:hypothetical protein